MERAPNKIAMTFGSEHIPREHVIMYACTTISNRQDSVGNALGEALLQSRDPIYARVLGELNARRCRPGPDLARSQTTSSDHLPGSGRRIATEHGASSTGQSALESLSSNEVPSRLRVRRPRARPPRRKRSCRRHGHAAAYVATMRGARTPDGRPVVVRTEFGSRRSGAARNKERIEAREVNGRGQDSAGGCRTCWVRCQFLTPRQKYFCRLFVTEATFKSSQRWKGATISAASRLTGSRSVLMPVALAACRHCLAPRRTYRWAAPPGWRRHGVRR